MLMFFKVRELIYSTQVTLFLFILFYLAEAEHQDVLFLLVFSQSVSENQTEQAFG